MVKIPEGVREAFTKNRIIPLATANSDGMPNVILVGMWWWEDDETMVIVNNYLNKTWANLEENPQVSSVGWNREGRGCYQIKGMAELKSEGPLYDKGHKMAIGRERPLPGKAVVVIKVKEVYQASGGPGAGDRIV
jgi:predicted pyridoxine 5'-phosphate oxidase superfamily flavin-nucleotide-binding protein